MPDTVPALRFQLIGYSERSMNAWDACPTLFQLLRARRVRNLHSGRYASLPWSQLSAQGPGQVLQSAYTPCIRKSTEAKRHSFVLLTIRTFSSKLKQASYYQWMRLVRESWNCAQEIVGVTNILLQMNRLLLEVEMILNCIPCYFPVALRGFPSPTLTGADPEAQAVNSQQNPKLNDRGPPGRQTNRFTLHSYTSGSG